MGGRGDGWLVGERDNKVWGGVVRLWVRNSSLLQEPEIIVHTTSSTATTDHTDNTTSSSSSSSSSSAPPAGSHYLSSQLLSEKTKLARKIREYNRKTTPVNHIHIKSASSSVSGGRGRGGGVRGGKGGWRKREL